MKNLYLILIFIALAFFAYKAYEAWVNFTPLGSIKDLEKYYFTLKNEEIDKIELVKYNDEDQKIKYQLNNDEIEKFVDIWKSAKCIGWRKYVNHYYLEINLKNGDLKTLRIDNQLMRIGEVAFKVKTNSLLENLENKLNRSYE